MFFTPLLKPLLTPLQQLQFVLLLLQRRTRQEKQQQVQRRRGSNDSKCKYKCNCKDNNHHERRSSTCRNCGELAGQPRQVLAS